MTKDTGNAETTTHDEGNATRNAYTTTIVDSANIIVNALTNVMLNSLTHVEGNAMTNVSSDVTATNA